MLEWRRRWWSIRRLALRQRDIEWCRFSGANGDLASEHLTARGSDFHAVSARRQLNLQWSSFVGRRPTLAIDEDLGVGRTNLNGEGSKISALLRRSDRDGQTKRKETECETNGHAVGEHRFLRKEDRERLCN